MRHRILPAVTVFVLAAAAVGCGGGDAASPSTGTPAGAGTPSTASPADTTTAAEPTSTDTAEALPDSPQAHVGVTATVGTLPDLPTGDGVTVVASGQPYQSSIPMVVHNGTDGPISRVEVSGTVRDADDAAVTSGRSQGFLPPVVPAGAYTFGYVYAGPDDLPDGASVPEPNVDFEGGIGEFENITALDVDSVELTGDGVTGQLSNPHDVEVSGPVSVYLACFDADGQLVSVPSGYADRDAVPAGESATFTLSFYGRDLGCDSAVAAASGYVDPA